jgi:hypothetical protein
MDSPIAHRVSLTIEGAGLQTLECWISGRSIGKAGIRALFGSTERFTLPDKERLFQNLIWVLGRQAT